MKFPGFYSGDSLEARISRQEIVLLLAIVALVAQSIATVGATFNVRAMQRQLATLQQDSSLRQCPPAQPSK